MTKKIKQNIEFKTADHRFSPSRSIINLVPAFVDQKSKSTNKATKIFTMKFFEVICIPVMGKLWFHAQYKSIDKFKFLSPLSSVSNSESVNYYLIGRNLDLRTKNEAECKLSRDSQNL